MGWCTAPDEKFWRNIWLAPCGTSTALASLTLLSVLCLAYLQIKRVREARRRFSLERRPLDRNGIAVCAALSLLMASHLLWLLLAASAYTAPQYRLFWDAVLLASWALTQAAFLRSWQAVVRTAFMLASTPGALAYAWELWVGAWRCSGALGPVSAVDIGQLVTTCLQLLAVATLLYVEATSTINEVDDELLKEPLLAGDEENPLPGHGLPTGPAPGPAGPFATLISTPKSNLLSPAEQARMRKRSWYQLIKIALIYVWPSSLTLQLRCLLCVLIVVLVRILNLATPLVYKYVVDTLADVSNRTHADPPEHFTWWQVFSPYVLAYAVLLFFQGGVGSGGGLLSNWRSYLWIPVTQDAYRRISMDLFAHVLDLDLNFHLRRKTGEVRRIMDRGTGAIQQILSTVFFNIGPQLLDIGVACTYLATQLEPFIALILFVTLISYIPLTIYLTEWRGRFRRDMNQADNAMSAKMTDALLNYETVKYFNNEELEHRGFGEAIGKYQRIEFRLLVSLTALNIVQTSILYTGLIIGLCVCVRGVAAGRLRVGDAVLFITLMQQLFAPLNYFGSFYRQIQQMMYDMENMFDLLNTPAELQDKPGAMVLNSSIPASVAFDHVTFEYHPGHPVLNDVSFSVPAGKTLALVGATGSGKSTVLRLLFRFYDPLTGCVQIGGQDIASMTQQSVRRAIGVVPQDTVLFNDTILYNIRYGRPEASDEEVEKASAAASLHESIVTRFPLGYGTIVGERGLRLSGGEKQRVAFSRAILKNPSVLLLDEATSALDSITEKRIQQALGVMRTQRTTIIVAHRLSTIMDADIIVVLKDGRVLETGSHEELAAAGGLYAEMWRRQQEASPKATIEELAAEVEAEKAGSQELPVSSALATQPSADAEPDTASILSNGNGNGHSNGNGNGNGSVVGIASSASEGSGSLMEEAGGLPGRPARPAAGAGVRRAIVPTVENGGVLGEAVDPEEGGRRGGRRGGGGEGRYGGGGGGRFR